MFFCIPIFLGCQTQIKPEGEQVLIPCPRCHNCRVRFASQKYNLARLFLCAGCPFVPEVHMDMSHLPMERTKGEARHSTANSEIQPPVLVTGQPYGNQWVPPNVPGYQPAYIGQPQAVAAGNGKS